MVVRLSLLIPVIALLGGSAILLTSSLLPSPNVALARVLVDRNDMQTQLARDFHARLKSDLELLDNYCRQFESETKRHECNKVRDDFAERAVQSIEHLLSDEVLIARGQEFWQTRLTREEATQIAAFLETEAWRKYRNGLRAFDAQPDALGVWKQFNDQLRDEKMTLADQIE